MRGRGRGTSAVHGVSTAGKAVASRGSSHGLHHGTGGGSGHGDLNWDHGVGTSAHGALRVVVVALVGDVRRRGNSLGAEDSTGVDLGGRVIHGGSSLRHMGGGDSSRCSDLLVDSVSLGRVNLLVLGLGHSVDNLVGLSCALRDLLVLLTGVGGRSRLVLWNLVRLLMRGSLLDLVGRGRRGGRDLVGGGLGVGHPGKLRLLVVRVDSGVIDLDSVVVLVVLVDTTVNSNSGGRTEALTLIITRGTALSSTTATATRGTLRGVRGVGTAEGASVGDGEMRGRRDMGVLHLNRVVILSMLVNTSVGVDSDGHVEGLALIISGRTTESSATIVRSPVTLEGATEGQNRGRVDISVLDINGVVVLAVLVDVRVEVSSDRTAVADTLIITRRTTKSSTSVVTGVAGRAVVTTAARTTQGSAAFLRAETLDPVVVQVVLGNVEVITVEVAIVVIVIGLVERRRATEVRRTVSGRVLRSVVRRTSRTTLEVRRRVHMNRSNDGRRVDVLVLDINRVVILGRLIDISVEVTSDRHVEGLALIVSRRTTLSSAAGRPTALDGERSSTGGQSRARVHVRRVDISVLDLDGVVILAVLIHVAVSVNIGTVGSIEVAILIISGWATKSCAANLGLKAVVVAGLNAIVANLDICQ